MQCGLVKVSMHALIIGQTAAGEELRKMTLRYMNEGQGFVGDLPSLIARRLENQEIQRWN